MCRATRCRTCGRTTWAGCGQHISEVRAGVSAAEWCGGEHTEAEREAAGPARGLLSRILGR